MCVCVCVLFDFTFLFFFIILELLIHSIDCNIRLLLLGSLSKRMFAYCYLVCKGSRLLVKWILSMVFNLLNVG